MGGEFSNESHNAIYSSNYWYIFTGMPLFNAPKKHVKLFCACVVSRSPSPDEHRLCLFVTTLLCAALGIFGWYVNEMLHLRSWICALTVYHPVLELRSRTNLPCLVNLALCLLKHHIIWSFYDKLVQVIKYNVVFSINHSELIYEYIYIFFVRPCNLLFLEYFIKKIKMNTKNRFLRTLHVF